MTHVNHCSGPMSRRNFLKIGGLTLGGLGAASLMLDGACVDGSCNYRYDGRTAGIVELSLFLGLPLAWAVWELVKLRRERRRDREDDETP